MKTKPCNIWTDPSLAAAWSQDPTRANPTRAEQLDVMLNVIVDVYQPGKPILDIGIGSGLVEKLLFDKLPSVHIDGVDISPAMVDLAHERLKHFREGYSIVLQDLTRLDDLSPPHAAYQIVFSVQTLHHVPDDTKLKVIDFVHEHLEPDGWFFLLERIAVGSQSLFPAYASVWDRLNRTYDALVDEGDSYDLHEQYLISNGDQPATLEEHLDWFRAAGFEAGCLHAHGNRALLAARKGAG